MIATAASAPTSAASETSWPCSHWPNFSAFTNSMVAPRPTGPRWMAQPGERYSGPGMGSMSRQFTLA